MTRRPRRSIRSFPVVVIKILFKSMFVLLIFIVVSAILMANKTILSLSILQLGLDFAEKEALLIYWIDFIKTLPKQKLQFGKQNKGISSLRQFWYEIRICSAYHIEVFWNFQVGCMVVLWILFARKYLRCPFSSWTQQALNKNIKVRCNMCNVQVAFKCVLLKKLINFLLFKVKLICGSGQISSNYTKSKDVLQQMLDVLLCRLQSYASSLIRKELSEVCCSFIIYVLMPQLQTHWYQT